MSGQTAVQTNEEDQNPEPCVLQHVLHVQSQLTALTTFIERRFQEVSVEVNATAQQMDMAEESIIGRFTEILEVIGAISFKGDGKTPANAGVELDAVVEVTEDAAQRIMDAATNIGALAENDDIWGATDPRAAFKDAVEKETTEIFMACSFQDITGQRIRNALSNLEQIESNLSGALEKLGINIEIAQPKAVTELEVSNQDDIDALFD